MDPQSNLLKSAFILKKPYDTDLINHISNQSCRIYSIEELYQNPYFRFQSLARKYISSNFKHPSLFQRLNVNSDIDAAISKLIESFSQTLLKPLQKEGAGFTMMQDGTRRMLTIAGEQEPIRVFEKMQWDTLCQVNIREFYNDIFKIVNKLAVKLNSLAMVSVALKESKLYDSVNITEVEVKLGELVDYYFDIKQGLAGVDFHSLDIESTPTLFYDKIWAEATDPIGICGLNINIKFLLMLIEKLFNGILPPEQILRITHFAQGVNMEDYFIYNTVSEESLIEFSHDIGEDVERILMDDINIPYGFNGNNRPLEEQLREQLSKGLPEELQGKVLSSLYRNPQQILNKDFLEQLKMAQQKEKKAAMERKAQELRDSLPPGVFVTVTNGDRVIRIQPKKKSRLAAILSKIRFR